MSHPLSVDQLYEDIAEKFYAEPLQWLASRYRGKPLPTHLVMFDVLIPVVQDFLSKHHFSKVGVATTRDNSMTVT